LSFLIHLNKCKTYRRNKADEEFSAVQAKKAEKLLLLNRQRTLKVILGLRALYFAQVGIIRRFKGNVDVKDESGQD